MVPRRHTVQPRGVPGVLVLQTNLLFLFSRFAFVRTGFARIMSCFYLFLIKESDIKS